MQAFIIKSSMGWVHVVCEVHLHRQQKKIQSQTKFRSALENTTLSANSNAFYYKRLGSSHIMDAEPKVWEPSMNCRATTLSSAELAISDPSLCQTLLPLSRKHRQPHKCFLPVYWASWTQFSYSVTCPPLIRPISLMQAILKAWSFQITLKSTARRVWLIWTARTFSLAIVSGPIWPWGGCAWIRPRTLIGTHQSASFARQKARLLGGPRTRWSVVGLLLHLGSDFLMHQRSGFWCHCYLPSHLDSF